MDLCTVRVGNKLVPATQLDLDRLDSVRSKRPMQTTLIFTRSSPLNRWYRGLCSIVAEGLDMHPEQLHQELKFRAGLIEQIIMVKSPKIGNGVAVRLRSTAFAAMEDGEFREYVNLATEIIFRDYLPGVRRKDVYKRVEEWVGPRPR
jgi:hypothetical protein